MSTVEFFEWIKNMLTRGYTVALITIIGKEGSGPRDLGAMMAISSDGSKYGTIGGGDVESILVNEALKAINERKSRRLKIALRPENIPEDAVKSNMMCGGVSEFFINVIQPEPRLIIIGAGHVGKPIADVAGVLNYRIVVVDKNPDLASRDRYPRAEVYVGDIVETVSKLDLSENDVVVIVYGEPETDYRVLRELVKRGFKGHIWALCSKRRAKWMIDRLIEEGLDVEPFKPRIHAPAGLDIGSDTPEEIAISIVAEIVCELKKCSKPVKSMSIVS